MSTTEPTPRDIYDELVLLREAIADLMGANRAVLASQTTIIKAMPVRLSRHTR
ncbi:hypothetical protein [Streptomyces sp. NPDC047009]|uniref:hypothetical protein n=1 Tax=Streptomyces sp. NPDC047009 TaxID=3154496 RepID=UPI0034057E93